MPQNLLMWPSNLRAKPQWSLKALTQENFDFKVQSLYHRRIINFGHLGPRCCKVNWGIFGCVHVQLKERGGTLLQNAGLIVNRGIIRGSRKEAKLYTCSMSKRKSPGVFLTAKNPPKCNHKLSGQTFCIRFITLHSCIFFILITAISKSCPKCWKGIAGLAFTFLT